MSKNDLRGGPSYLDCVNELHLRVEEFATAYSTMTKRFPEKFPIRPLDQRKMNRLFSSYLILGRIIESPVEPLDKPTP